MGKEIFVKNLVEEDYETAEGFRAVVVFNHRSGSRCGYIFVPASDKAYVEPTYKEFVFAKTTRKIMEYNVYDLEVNGGITFGEESEPEHDYPVQTDIKGTWLGWDYAHCDDAPDFEKWETLIETDEDRTVFDIHKNMDNEIPSCGGHVWTQDEVKAECDSVSRQLYIMTKGKLDEQDD